MKTRLKRMIERKASADTLSIAIILIVVVLVIAIVMSGTIKDWIIFLLEQARELM